jgi:hypothetical protein
MMIASLSLVAFPAELFGKLLLREQPSNFGNYLKLLIPSYLSEPSNYWCMVINQKIYCKIIMDYRESKSGFIKPVKEQRIDGGLHKIFISVYNAYSKEFRNKLSNNKTPFISNNILNGFIGYKTQKFGLASFHRKINFSSLSAGYSNSNNINQLSLKSTSDISYNSSLAD